MSKKDVFTIRNATQKDLPQLLELEKIWPEASRATEQELNQRIERFAAGYFVAEDNLGIISSMITHPYVYNPNDLSSFDNWDNVNQACLTQRIPFDDCNALYILSGTSKTNHYAGALFSGALACALNLAKEMGKSYVLAGALLPGYARFVKKYGMTTAQDYVFKQSNHRFVDPLIERYRRVGFYVPSKEHVLADYYPDSNSLNYSALVVKPL